MQVDQQEGGQPLDPVLFEAGVFATEAGVLLTNDLACKQLAWLLQQHGQDSLRQAIAGLVGRRRPYPLNIAHVLGVRLPSFSDAETGGDGGNGAHATAPAAPVSASEQSVTAFRADDVQRGMKRDARAALDRENDRLEWVASAAQSVAHIKAIAARALARRGLPPHKVSD